MATHVLTNADDGQSLVAQDGTLGAAFLGDDAARPVWAAVANALGEVKHAGAICRRLGVVYASEDSGGGDS